MPEFNDKSNTVKSYNSNLIPTGTIENFLSNDIVEKVLKVYNSLSDSLTKVLKTPARIVEFDFENIENNKAMIAYVFYDTSTRDYLHDSIDDSDDLYSSVMESMDTSILHELKSKIMDSLQKNNISNASKFRQISLHNLDEFLPVHCDGNNIIDRHTGRKDFPLTKIEQWADNDLLNNPEQNTCALQGMITIDSNNKYYGTAVFDQWFPWSTYYMPDCTEENMPRQKKSRITFLKGDEPFRFNEEIRLHTGKEFSEHDWRHLSASQHPRVRTLKREQFYGLSLDRVTLFGKPGTLNYWDGKKYHMTMPWNPQFETKRIMIQFETFY